jgi:hypothetical protein
VGAANLASQFDVPATVMAAPPGIIVVKAIRDGTAPRFWSCEQFNIVAGLLKWAHSNPSPPLRNRPLL